MNVLNKPLRVAACAMCRVNMFSGVKFNILEIREGYRNMRKDAAKEKRNRFVFFAAYFVLQIWSP